MVNNNAKHHPFWGKSMAKKYPHPVAPNMSNMSSELADSSTQALVNMLFLDSLDWFKGKTTGNHGFYHQI